MASDLRDLLRFIGPGDLELLARVKAEDVTWRHAGPGTSYRLWSSETDYEIVTKRMAPLVSFGFAKCGKGWRMGHGPMELRPEGEHVLETEDEPVPSGEGGDHAE